MTDFRGFFYICLVVVASNAQQTANTKGTVDLVPKMPTDFQLESSEFKNLWTTLTDNEDAPLNKGPQPLTLTPPTDAVMTPLKTRSNHLFSDFKVGNPFLQNYMIAEKVDPKDSKLTSTNGFVVKNMNGKDMVFKTDSKGITTINDVTVGKMTTLDEGTVVFSLEALLFNDEVLATKTT